MEMLIDWLGDSGALAFAGVVFGILFGVAARKSHFCLRASTIERPTLNMNRLFAASPFGRTRKAI